MSDHYRCTAHDSGCDESTIRPFLVTNHDGTVERADYCEDCLFLARIDWNGETALVEHALIYRDPHTGEERAGVFTREWPEHNAIGLRLADGHETVVSRANLLEVTHA